MATPNELSRDPLFQLNTLLWLTQSLPAGICWKPLFRSADFEVYAIAPMLAPPPDLLLAAKDSQFPFQERCRPDIVLNRANDKCFVLVECKGRSFGTASTAAEQARTFLIVSGPRLHESLGLPASDVGKRLASYLVAEEDMPLMEKTLAELLDEMNARGLPAGEVEPLGLRVGPDSLSLVVGHTLKSLLGLDSSAEKFLDFEQDTDPRPLYIVPYDPDCNQSQEERTFCKRILFERIHTAVLGAAGRAVPPREIIFKTEDLLNEAMMGMYDLWENQESIKHMRRIARQLLSKLAQIVCNEIRGAFTHDSNVGWKLRLSDQEEQKAVCDILARFSCETMDLKVDPASELFD